MRILWVTSRPIAGTCGTSKSSSSGSWLDAAYESCKDCNEIELHIASLGEVESIRQFESGRHKFYLLPRGKKVLYDIKKKSHIADWNELKDIVKPDVVQIWGTEHTEYLLVSNLFVGIPQVIYIQGVVTKVAKEYNQGLSLKDRLLNISLQDLFRKSWLDAAQRKYKKQSEIERKILKNACSVIVENDWCAAQIGALAPDCQIYRSKLPIKSVFFKYTWDIDNMKRHTIFTNAGGYPIKGHHILFEAMHYVVAKYPDAKLYVPGISRMGDGFVNWSRRKGYENLLRKIIKKYGLENNIIYTGVLTADQMAEKIAESNVYVMPSCVENHSSSLIEAMIVGAPCISSFVGGVSSVARHQENALLYSYSDPEIIADYIIRLFGKDSEAKYLSNNAMKIRESRQVNLLLDFLPIYKALTK